MENRIFSFEKLVVWEESRALNKRVYNLTTSFASTEKICLVDQVRRSAI
jgi:four helix bundle protein